MKDKELSDRNYLMNIIKLPSEMYMYLQLQCHLIFSETMQQLLWNLRF